MKFSQQYIKYWSSPRLGKNTFFSYEKHYIIREEPFNFFYRNLNDVYIILLKRLYEN